MAQHLLVDLYECSPDILNDLSRLRAVARQAVSDIGASVVEECVHQFDPIGITYIAVITTSHFSIHTWPEHGYAAVDVFSCDNRVPEALAGRLAEAFGTSNMKYHLLEREIPE